MTPMRIAGFSLLGGVLLWLAGQVVEGAKTPPAAPVVPATPQPPDPKPTPKRKPLLRPWLVEASVGGPIAPDGTEVLIDLPASLQRKNTASKGLGNCVFTSIHHSALWQDVPALQEFPQWLITKGIPGGGYPSKVADLVPKIAKERGLPTPDFLQVESRDLEILKLACKTGRMPGVTYSRSPTGRYGGQKIAHMVSLVHASDAWFCVLDNNYIGPTSLEWMTPSEFLATYTGGGGNGWAVILLDAGPPPCPRN